MEKLADLLPSNAYEQTARWTSDELGNCTNCEAELELDRCGEPVLHGCCYCQDGRFVRGEFDGNRATLRPCPRCANNEPAAYEPARFRVPHILANATLDSWLPDNGGPRMAAERFVASWPPEPYMLLLTGPPGRGKSHIAAGIQRRVFERHGKSSRFWVVPELLDRIKATFNEERRHETVDEIHNEMGRIPLLILDDLGTEKSTEWAEEELFKIVDRRYREGLPLVVTTNLETVHLDARLESRLTDRTHGRVVAFDGNRYPDRRQKAVNA